MRKLFPALLFLIAPALVAGEVDVQASATVLTDIRFETDVPYITFDSAMVRDGASSFVATPGGVYRLPSVVRGGAEATVAAFPRQLIHNLYVHDGELYVMKEGKENRGPATDHSFLRSSDGGQTFVPLDQGLEACLGEWCAFMTPTEAIFRDGAIILNAGSNVVATADDGASWTPLIGELTPAACYHPTLAIAGSRLLVGGECPLDTAYIRHGLLSDNSLQYSNEVEAITPALENRNVQFIRRVRESDTLISGIEGAILRSSDQGLSFDFAFRQPIESEQYVYFTTFLAPRAKSNLLLIGGFDKGNSTAALMVSFDDGVSWKDRTQLLRFDDYLFDALVFLHEDGEGRILAGLLQWEQRMLRIVELNIGTRSRTVRR
jgi:hypothetical protein